MDLWSLKARVAVAAALLLGWFASLFLPVVTTTGTNGEQHFKGLNILALGWLGPLQGHTGWFANPLLAAVVGLLLISGPAVSQGTLNWLSVAMALFVLNSAFWFSLTDSVGVQRILERGPGYFLWMAVMAACLVWMQLLYHAPGRG